MKIACTSAHPPRIYEDARFSLIKALDIADLIQIGKSDEEIAKIATPSNTSMADIKSIRRLVQLINAGVERKHLLLERLPI